MAEKHSICVNTPRRKNSKANVFITMKIIFLFFALLMFTTVFGQRKTEISDSLGIQLLDAADIGNYELVVQLLNHGANINFQDKKGYTPLIVASEKGRYSCVKALLLNGADVNLAAKGGYNALDQAVQYNYPVIAGLLLDNKARINDASRYYGLTPLQAAVSLGYTDMLNVLLAYSPNLENQGVAGMTALHLAVTANNDTITLMLLDAGASINAIDKKGYTPLMLASQYGYTEMARLLLENGADPKILTSENISALLLALYNYHDETAKVLLQFGADPNPPSYKRLNPLSLAKITGQNEAIEVLKGYQAIEDPRPSFSGISMGFSVLMNDPHIMADFYAGVYEIKYNFSITAGFAYDPEETKVREKISGHLFHQYRENRKMIYLKTTKFFNLDRNNFVFPKGLYVSLAPVYTFASYEGLNDKPDPYFTFLTSAGLWLGLPFVKFYAGYQYLPLRSYQASPHWMQIGLQIDYNLLMLNNRRAESFMQWQNINTYE